MALIEIANQILYLAQGPPDFIKNTVLTVNPTLPNFNIILKNSGLMAIPRINTIHSS